MPAPSKRPAREQLAQAIRHHGGNLTSVAASLDCSRQTLYRWVYQLGLARLAGVEPHEARQRIETAVTHTNKDSAVVTLRGRREPRLDVVASNITLPDPPEPRRQRGVVIPDSVWEAAQIEAVKRRISASEVVTIALRRLLVEMQEQGQQ